MGESNDPALNRTRVLTQLQVVPAYTMAPHSEKLKMLRVVVREDFSKSRCDSLLRDIKMSVETLSKFDEDGVEKYKK